MFKKLTLTPFLFLFLFSCAYCAQVEIGGSYGQWQLLVDKKPFYIKGAGCGLGEGKKGEDYLKLAKELGANAVRTWGIDQGDKQYLDAANSYGLYVCAGIWVNYATDDNGISFLSGDYSKEIEKEALSYVEEFKNHPAVLAWGLGNECIFFTQREEEKIALSRFLNELIEKIHKIDPNHPVVYASAGYNALEYIKKYIPALDIIGMNAYASLRPYQGAWQYLKIDKPYILTEFGPPIPYQSSKDKNGASIEIGDKQKAIYYREFINQMREFKGANLGGFAFHLGETTQESMTWWNINYLDFKKYPYWAVYKLYTLKEPDNSPPVIKSFKLNKTRLRKKEFVEIDFSCEDPENDQMCYELKVSTAYEGILRYYVNEFVDGETEGLCPATKIQAPEKSGLYRVYLLVYDGKGNAASLSKTILVE